MSRLQVIAVVGALALAFSSGYLLGVNSAVAPPPPPPPPEPVAEVPAPEIEPAPRTPLEEIEFAAASGDLHGAARLALRYVDDNPGDAPLLFMLTGLLAEVGAYDEIFRRLLDFLQFSTDPRAIAEARDTLLLHSEDFVDALIDADAAGAVQAHLERLTQFDHLYDGHRVRLIQWLIGTDQLATAERLLRETGYVGATEEEHAELAAALQLANNRFQIVRHENGLSTALRLNAGSDPYDLDMVIDTGASMTAIHVDRLRAVGAQDLGESRRVLTANGATVMPVYRVFDVQVGPVFLPRLDVLGMRSAPRDSDGLLGMDLIQQLPSLPTGTP